MQAFKLSSRVCVMSGSSPSRNEMLYCTPLDPYKYYCCKALLDSAFSTVTELRYRAHCVILGDLLDLPFNRSMYPLWYPITGE